jgi:microcystin-dependent protein
MSEPYLGQLSLVGFNFAPIGWMLSQGQILPITQYAALFSLLGTYYGGNGTSNFALPNLQGNVAIGYGQGAGLNYYDIGEDSGSPTVTLTAAQTPSHTHTPMARTIKAVPSTPVGNSFAESSSGNFYATSDSAPTAMNSNVIPVFGGNQPHNNMMPFLGMYWIIAYQGIYPSRG